MNKKFLVIQAEINNHVIYYGTWGIPLSFLNSMLIQDF